jgi:mRNA-degrading endonuclease toxin of MazEF toxin-antitoxin module
MEHLYRCWTRPVLVEHRGLDRGVTRGQIWFAGVGRKRRPVLVLTRFEVIDVRALVTVAEVTTSIRGIAAEVEFDPEEAGLDRPSVVKSETVRPGLTSMPRTRRLSPSTMRSTSRSPPRVRRWETVASAAWAKTRTDRVARDSSSAPSRVRVAGWTGPARRPASRPSTPTPRSRAARAGSASWCRGGPASRAIRLGVGSQAGTGSMIQSR